MIISDLKLEFTFLYDKVIIGSMPRYMNNVLETFSIIILLVLCLGDIEHAMVIIFNVRTFSIYPQLMKVQILCFRIYKSIFKVVLLLIDVLYDVCRTTIPQNRPSLKFGS